MKILVFGSLNIDKVYSLPHLPDKGEMLGCEEMETHVGGKGLNQALALKKAGADVVVAGMVGKDGAFLTNYLTRSGVCAEEIGTAAVPTGHAIIGIDPQGRNQMIIFGGANRAITEPYCDAVLARHGDADLLLTQYETACVEYMLRRAHEQGITTAVNPSPYVDAVKGLPYDCIDWLILNEDEGRRITGETDDDAVARALFALGGSRIILTLGDRGALYYDGETTVKTPAFAVNAVDTTGAGDTFTGYSLFALLGGKPPQEALRTAAAAAAIAVTRKGAAETIPDRAQTEAFLKERQT